MVARWKKFWLEEIIFSCKLQGTHKSKGMEKPRSLWACIHISRFEELSDFFPRRSYGLSLTPTSYAAGASHNRAPLEMISFNSCDLSSPAEPQPTFLCPRTHIMHRLHE
ncbi:hypothetical protein ATANTOWER_002624 [Ataeniobius toweri]|uniref:Uncharacterized protein n=1 Tax=Ataeniobius toweri TaxID=208326 RepID=A0ABU7BWK7_9TELE|nr:hypothetical protein [Ataeniobius toweri]